MSLSPARRASSAAGAVPPARPAAAAVPAEAAASRRNSQPGFAASLPPSAVRPADVARPARSAAAFAMRVRGGELQVLLLRARWTRRGMQFIMRRCQEDPEDDDCEMSRLFIRGVSGAARDAVAHTTRAERQLIAAGVDELWARGDVPSAWLRDDEMSNRAFAERNLPLFARLAAAFDEDNPEARDPPTEWALPHRDVREGQSPAELAAHALQVDAGVAAGSRGPVFQLRVGPTAAVVLRKDGGDGEGEGEGEEEAEDEWDIPAGQSREFAGARWWAVAEAAAAAPMGTAHRRLLEAVLVHSGEIRKLLAG